MIYIPFSRIPFAGILSLPPELSDKIIGYLPAQDIFTLRCVNKTLCSLLTPAAFRQITVYATEKSVQGFLDLLHSPDIAKHIRVIRIIEISGNEDLESEYGDSYDDEIREEEEERLTQVAGRLRDACFMLHLIPTLESLVFKFFPDEDAWVNPNTWPDNLIYGQYYPFQWDVLKGLVCNPNPLPALQSLQIDSWYAYPKEMYHKAPFERIVSSLRDLRFLVQNPKYTNDDNHFPVEDFWKDVIGPRVLQPAVNLTSLVMESSEEFGSRFRLDLSPISCPRLTSLLLSNLIWDDTGVNPQLVVSQAEDFIVRHGKTLKRLELHNCMICVPPHASTPVLSWAAVWHRFADELTELVELVVAYSPGRRYFCFLPEHGFEANPAAFQRGTEQDTLALKAFDAIVKERKRLTSRDGNY